MKIKSNIKLRERRNLVVRDMIVAQRATAMRHRNDRRTEQKIRREIEENC